MQFISRNTLENYSKMNNAFLLDPDLTPQAKGTLAIILTNKDDWRIYPKEIANRSKSSEGATISYFKELEKAGYMRVIKKGLGRGKGIQAYRYVSDVKINDKYFFEYIMPKFEKWFKENELSTDN